MRVTEYINLCNIQIDRHSITPQTLDFAMKIKSGEVNEDELAPIKVFRDESLFVLKDGRHRVTAFKLLGREKIKATFSTKNYKKTW